MVGGFEVAWSQPHIPSADVRHHSIADMAELLRAFSLGGRAAISGHPRFRESPQAGASGS
jgi:hypothetical protein